MTSNIPSKGFKTRGTRVFATAVGILALMLLLSGCGLTDAISDLLGTVEETTDKTLAVLDDAIDALADASADWQIVLQDTIAQLTDDAQSTIRNEISNLLARGVAAAGGEFRCDVDFLRTRVRQDLISIRAKLLGVEIEEAAPSFCAVVPLAVDASLVPDRLNVVEFYGYDFDTTAPIQVLLRNGNRDVDVTSHLDRPTHYHMTLNLGGSGAQLSSNSQRFVVRWKDKDISTIGIIQPATPVCKSKLVKVSPGSITYIPPHTRGDREFEGHGPRVQANVRLQNFKTRVEARVYMHAKETKSDWTTAEGAKNFRIYTPEPGWKVQGIVGGLESEFTYTDNDHPLDTFALAAGGPAKRFVFKGDGKGKDAGIHTQVKVDFNRLQFELIETKDCVSERAIVGAVLVNLIEATTLKQLKPSISEEAWNEVPAERWTGVSPELRKEIPQLLLPSNLRLISPP